MTHAIAIEELPSFEHLKLEENGSFSDNFVDMIHQCLQKDPNKRATTEELLAHPLFIKHDCEGQMNNPNNDGAGGTSISLDSSTDLRASGLESLCQSMSESMLKSTSIQSLDRTQGGSLSASVERISELDQIAEHVVKYYQRERLTGNVMDENGKIIGPSTPLKDIDVKHYREWGDSNEISKLYMKPAMLKRLARQLGLPYHLVCRKFDKKAAQLMGTSVSSPSFGKKMIDQEEKSNRNRNRNRNSNDDDRQILSSVDLTRLSGSGVISGGVVYGRPYGGGYGNYSGEEVETDDDISRSLVVSGVLEDSEDSVVSPFRGVSSVGSIKNKKGLKNKPAGLKVFTES